MRQILKVLKDLLCLLSYNNNNNNNNNSNTNNNDNKNTKIKAAVKLYCNADPMMAAVRSFEELAVKKDTTPSLKMLRSAQRSWIYSCG